MLFATILDLTLDFPEAACFLGSTVVQTKWGHTEIESIRPGDEVLSRCEKTGEIGYRKVLECFVHEKIQILNLFYIDEDGNTSLPISTTAEHPFWVKGRGWTATSCLQPGDIIETCNGGKYAPKSKWEMPAERTEIFEGATVTVDSVSEAGLRSTVYNLTVEDFHTYFVGWDGLWVHNTKNTEVKVEPLNPKLDETATAEPNSEWNLGSSLAS